MTDLKKKQCGCSSSSGTRFSSEKKTLPLEYKHVISCNLSQDLLVEIFSRLPTKPLIRLKCVCKTWYHLISTVVYPQRSVLGLFYKCLKKSHFDHPSEYHRCGQFHYIPMLNGKGDDDANITDAPLLGFLPSHPNTRIVDCRNGLLLCSAKNFRSYSYFICNPVTRQWASIPKQQNDGEAIAALVFISTDSPHYKVIKFYTTSNFLRKTHLDLDIYSSKTGRWVLSKVSVNPAIVGALQRHNVFVNGALYLLSTVHQVLRFDVKEESCQMIELPTELWIPVVFPCSECLGESDGSLMYAHYDGSIMKIWSLDDTDANEWVMTRIVSICAVDDLTPMPIASFNILAFHPHLDKVFLQVGDKILSYDFPSRSLAEVCILSCEDVNYFWFWVQPFSECLCSLEGTYRRLRSLK